VRARDARITTLAQVRRHHIRQQLTPEEQQEFDEHYGEEDDLMYEEEDEEGELEDQEDEDDLDDEADENQDQMDYYMQQHPELLLALDIAAFRRQQMQQRLHANRSADERQPAESTGRSGHSLFPQDQTNREDLGPSESDRQDPPETSPRVNLYANLAVEQEG